MLNDVMTIEQQELKTKFNLMKINSKVFTFLFNIFIY